MAVLTIVEGASYREIADVKKIKDIPIKAPRGKIFDRNGVVLDRKAHVILKLHRLFCTYIIRG